MRLKNLFEQDDTYKLAEPMGSREYNDCKCEEARNALYQNLKDRLDGYITPGERPEDIIVNNSCKVCGSDWELGSIRRQNGGLFIGQPERVHDPIEDKIRKICTKCAISGGYYGPELDMRGVGQSEASVCDMCKQPSKYLIHNPQKREHVGPQTDKYAKADFDRRQAQKTHDQAGVPWKYDPRLDG